MIGYATNGYGGGRGKLQQAQSSEEELGCGDDGAAAAKRVSQTQSSCPWQRIKWTDGMVRLLVWVVHSIGEDSAAGDCGEQKGKKAAEAAGMQQKKGKWKSVSRAMMEKGFSVSPQQCEDKFNDLNKRYKRVNELVGKEAARMTVNNPALLDSLVDRLPRKAMEEARKLLSSKHIFFHEMYAYHNASPVSAAAGPSLPNDYSPSVIKGQSTGGGTEEKEDGDQHDHHDIVEEEEEEQDYNDESDEKDEYGREILDLAGKGPWAKRKSGLSPAALTPLSLSLSSLSGGSATPVQQMKSEMMGIHGEQQQRWWLRMKAAELEEQRVVYQNRALQLERQRFKWLRFCGGKEREMERMSLRNERRRLENDRLLLLLQQKELSFVDPAAKVGDVDHRENL